MERKEKQNQTEKYAIWYFINIYVMFFMYWHTLRGSRGPYEIPTPWRLNRHY